MSDGALFEAGGNDDATRRKPALAPRGGRMRRAVRNQVEFQECALDELLPEDHSARIIWDYMCGLGLTELTARIQAVEGGPGQAPADPRILLALWLYATLRGVGSARELDRLCKQHGADRWICGGVSMNYHGLSDFRTAHVDLLDRLLTKSVASLLAEGLVSLDRVAQDGMKVRAIAGAASFRRQPTREEALQEAETQLATLREELAADPSAGKSRQQAARQRAAKERAARIRGAWEQLPRIAERRKAQDREKARCSTTDPDARVMKGPDGGYRPSSNVQLATATNSPIITGVEVTHSGGDQGQLAPMIAQHQARYDQQPREALVDGGFVKLADIEAVSAPPAKDDPEETGGADRPRGAGGTQVYAPVMESKTPGRDPHTPRADDSPAVAEWRRRMATEEAKAIYRQRASTAECVNAACGRSWSADCGGRAAVRLGA